MDSSTHLATSNSNRHICQERLKEFGLSGQERLAKASVLVIGAGGLGCPALLYLAAAGIGRLGVVDPDRVEPSNLNRQILYEAGDIGSLKTDVAYRRLKSFDPATRVQTWPVRFSPANAMEILAGHDLVVDGTDNFSARYLINDACRRAGIPLIHGSVLRYEGLVSVFLPDGPCYRCLFPEPPEDVPDCAGAGVLGVLPGVIGSLLATEAIKWLTSTGTICSGRLLRYEALKMKFSEFHFFQDPSCQSCGPDAVLAPLRESPRTCPMPNPDASMKTIDAASLHQRRVSGEDLLLVDVREPHELDICRIQGALHIPLGLLSSRLAEIPRNKPVVLFCHHGIRSGRGGAFLADHGYENIINLAGGIHAWAEQIEPGMARY